MQQALKGQEPQFPKFPALGKFVAAYPGASIGVKVLFRFGFCLFYVKFNIALRGIPAKCPVKLFN
jgi:hypothetical protein